MEYKLLGRTGLRVSEFALGSARFGLGPTPEEAPRLVNHAIDQGINFFDTGFAYGNRSSFDRAGFPPASERPSAEELLGSALKGKRHRVVVSSKVGEVAPEVPMGPDGSYASPGPNDGGREGGGLSRQHMMKTIETSLKRLQTDYLDLYYAHWPDPVTPLEETLRTFDDLVHQGKIRYYGLSNYRSWQLMQAFAICERFNLQKPVCTQYGYSISWRQVEDFVVPVSEVLGLTMNCYSPLGSGLLAGSEGKAANPEGRPFAQTALDYADQLEALAKKWGYSLVQMSLAWLVARPVVSSAILGAESIAELDAGLKALDVKLDAEQIQELETLPEPPNWMPLKPRGSFHGPPF